MASAYTVFGLVTGVLGITGAIQLAWSYIALYLPSEQLKILEDTLDEANTLFHEGVEDGLLPNAAYLEDQLVKYLYSHCSTRDVGDDCKT